MQNTLVLCNVNITLYNMRLRRPNPEDFTKCCCKNIKEIKPFYEVRCFISILALSYI